MAANIQSLSDYNEGDVFRGETITTLYAAKSDFLIFEGDKSGEVTVATDDPQLRKQVSEISPWILVITGYLEKEKEKRKFVDQIGLAYTEAISGDIENAKKICDKIIQRIEGYKLNIGRFYYLLSCLSVVVSTLIISYFLKKYKFIPEIIPHFYMMTYASIGGFLSVAKDIKKVQIESSEFGWFQFFYGSIRILTTMFSGLIVYILIQSKLIFPVLMENGNGYAIAIIAFLSGFSETFLPNLLKQVENKGQEGDNQKTKPDEPHKPAS